MLSARCSAAHSKDLGRSISKRRSCAGVKPTSSAKVRGLVCRLLKRGPATMAASDIAAGAAPVANGAIPPLATPPIIGSERASRIWRSIRPEGDAMYTITKRFAFSASHIIGGLPADHRCARLHGHNYEVEVVLQSATLDPIGF